MELAARSVLEDCRLAHRMMTVESDPARLRVEWIGALALIRLVGDVLARVDAKVHPYLASDVAQHWKQLKESQEPIFWNFIKGARDRAVHEYDIDLYDQSEVEIAIVHSDGTIHADRLNDCLFMPLQGGYGEGEDARDIYLEAITWWDRELAFFEGSPD